MKGMVCMKAGDSNYGMSCNDDVLKAGLGFYFFRRYVGHFANGGNDFIDAHVTPKNS